MKKSLLVVLLVAIIFVVGCNKSSSTYIRNTQLKADEESTWKATLSAVKEFTGHEPASVDTVARTIVVKGNYVSKRKTWTVNVIINAKSKDDSWVQLPQGKGFTWVTVKTKDDVTMAELSKPENSREGKVVGEGRILDLFIEAIQEELSKQKKTVAGEA